MDHGTGGRESIMGVTTRGERCVCEVKRDIGNVKRVNENIKGPSSLKKVNALTAKVLTSLGLLRTSATLGLGYTPLAFRSHYFTM